VDGIRNRSCGMELRQSRVWNQAAGAFYARLRVMPYAFGNSMQCASALMTCQACGLDKKKHPNSVRMFLFW